MQALSDFDSVWGRLDSALKREQATKNERDLVRAQNELLAKEKESDKARIDALVKEKESDKARIDTLIKENERLKSSGLAGELEKLKKSFEQTKKYSEEKAKLLAETSESFYAEVRERKHVETQLDDVRDRLKGAEDVNAALIEHVRAQMTRLRSSRKEHGIACAEQVRAQAQASLGRVREYYTQQLELSHLKSKASQFKTQLDMISSYGLEGDVEAVEEGYETHVAEIQEMELLEEPEADLRLDPVTSVLLEEGAKSPFGEDFGIKSGWILEPLRDEYAESAESGEKDAPDDVQMTGPEQDAEVILAAAHSTSPRSVKIVDQFVSNIILKAAEDLMNEIADRVLTETTAIDQTPAEASKDPGVDASGAVGQLEEEVVAKDPKTGEVLQPLFTPLPPVSRPSDVPE